jgi:putative nucleotidyltransferase with HDIG domain
MIDKKVILRKLATIKEIPTLPEVMHEVLAALAEDDTSAGKLASILARDQALCSKILRIANSAFYSQNRKILNIDDAVVVLGFDSIAQLTLATSVFKAFDRLRPHERFDLYGFWKHSIASAVAGKLIAERSGDPEQCKVAYTAGLLHDIGKLVLVSYFSDYYLPVFERLQREDLYVYEAEMLELGFTHCSIGEWLCHRWNFPEILVRAIAEHHDGISAQSLSGYEVRAVHAANTLCNSFQIGNSGSTKMYVLDDMDCSCIGLDRSDVEAIGERLEESRREIESVMSAVT